MTKSERQLLERLASEGQATTLSGEDVQIANGLVPLYGSGRWHQAANFHFFIGPRAAAESLLEIAIRAMPVLTKLMPM